MWTCAAAPTAAAAVGATVAPSGSRARAFASVRFHTVTWWPFLRKRRAMPDPSSPVPSSAIRLTISLLGPCNLTLGEGENAHAEKTRAVRRAHRVHRGGGRAWIRPAPGGESARRRPGHVRHL